MISSFSVMYKESADIELLASKAGKTPTDKILIQIFSGVLDKDIVLRVVREISAKLPGVSIIGTSTAGEIHEGQSLEGNLLINVTLFEHTRVVTALTRSNDDLYASGREIGETLRRENCRVAILFGCGLKERKTIKGQYLLDGLQSVLPDTLIAGGQAGDNGHGETTFVFNEHGMTESGIAAAGLVGNNISASNTYNLSWVPIGKKLTITSVEDSRVYSINNETPYDIYCHYLGQEVADNLPLSAADFPFIIEKDGIPMAIHATGVNDDGSFEYIHDFHVGEQLRFGFCHAGLLALGAKQTYEEVSKSSPQALFIYSCVSRKWILGADIAVDLSSVAGLAPSAGFFCYGEYFYRDNGKASFFSQTMTVLSLSESDTKVQYATKPVAQSKLIDEHSRQFRTMRVLHRLVETSTREIESVNKELAQLVRLDSLTGLANRRRFDERLETALYRLNEAGNASDSLSIIMLDVDYFKAYNDTYGHLSGDSCLRGIAEILKRFCREESDTAARYGGEEFACILPQTDYEEAMSISQAIRKEIEALRIEHSDSEISDYVTASIGVCTTCRKDGHTPHDLLEKCDALLYKAKDRGRNCVAGMHE